MILFWNQNACFWNIRLSWVIRFENSGRKRKSGTGFYLKWLICNSLTNVYGEHWGRFSVRKDKGFFLVKCSAFCGVLVYPEMKVQCRFALSLLIGGHFCLHSRNEHNLLRHCILRILLPLECFRMICHSTITQCLKSAASGRPGGRLISTPRRALSTGGLSPPVRWRPMRPRTPSARTPHPSRAGESVLQTWENTLVVGSYNIQALCFTSQRSN